ncbi:hypothetical protein ACQKCH_15420 [Nubsella zeaxanthinifaciens]|uniref:hypothetical protein n=1 Tax=Nubsella zeaxanthinifaciens TaxID=392412 RepID=UPI003CFE3583
MGRTITYFVFFFLLLGFARYTQESAIPQSKRLPAASISSAYAMSIDACDIDEIYTSIKLGKSEDLMVASTSVLFFKTMLAHVFRSVTPSLCDTFLEIPQRPPLV